MSCGLLFSGGGVDRFGRGYNPAMTDSWIAVEVGAETRRGLEALAAARGVSLEALAGAALEAYLARESEEKRYPGRSPVGGIITPV